MDTSSVHGDPITGLGSSNGDLSIDFDHLQFPPLDVDYLSNDLMIPEGLLEELGFDSDFEFSLDNLTFPPENEGFGSEGSDGLCSTVSVARQNSGDGSSDDVAGFLSYPSPESGTCDREVPLEPVSSQDSAGCRSVVDGFFNSPSPDSGVNSQSGPASVSRDSPKSCNVRSGAVVVDDDEQKVKLEEGGRECLLKRKKEKEDESFSNNARSCKFRRAIHSENAFSAPDEEDKRKVRLMRNRESAQLSRQRKKHYVEELEDKVRSMHSVIADLNGKISYFMAENASLRQQLSGGAVCPPPGVYHPPPMASMRYPWIPCGYPMKPQGSQVPLVPIPKLKPQKPLSASKPTKSESKKSQSKTKKVASVSFLGLLFFLFLFGGLVPLVNVQYGGRREAVPSGFGSSFTNGGSRRWSQGRVLTVNSSHESGTMGLHTGTSGFRGHFTNGIRCESSREEIESEVRPNSSEPLVASLYVPRNDKLVKIDGNLIIHSVLASEKAMALSRTASGVKNDKTTVSSSKGARETGLAIPGNLPPVLAVSNDGRSHMYGSATERQKALSSSSGDTYKVNSKTSNNDGLLQKWFREGLEGPILSSGMCTEVFQFEISPTSVVPVTSVANISIEDPKNYTDVSKRMKNRRILDHLPIPLAELNATGQEGSRASHSQDGSSNGNRSASPMVVSVLFDPREAGDSESEGMISPKSLSRIFVVVLLDSVKYVTYSCMLPFKASSPPPLVTN